MHFYFYIKLQSINPGNWIQVLHIDYRYGYKILGPSAITLLVSKKDSNISPALQPAL